MKGLIALGLVIVAIFAYALFDRVYGDRLRAAYATRVRTLFPISFILIFGAAAAALFALSSENQQLAFNAGYYALMALGLNIVVGYAGLLDLGYVAFFAIGAYSIAILSGAGPIHAFHLSFWEILPIGIAVALIAGVVLGGPTLRLRGDYLAIVTLGFGEIVRIVVENLGNVTNGSIGISDIPRIKAFGVNFGFDARPYALLAVAFIAISVLLIRSLNHSRVGRAWAAIREDEVAAEAMGVPTLKYKLLAFAIGATVGSIAGMLFASSGGFVDPESFQLQVSIFVLASVVLGGIGSMAGVVIGAVLITLVPEMLRSLQSLGTFGDRLLDARFGIFGLVLVIMMIFRPQGVVPSRRRAAEIKGGAKETKGPVGSGGSDGAA